MTNWNSFRDTATWDNPSAVNRWSVPSTGQPRGASAGDLTEADIAALFAVLTGSSSDSLDAFPSRGSTNSTPRSTSGASDPTIGSLFASLFGGQDNPNSIFSSLNGGSPTATQMIEDARRSTAGRSDPQSQALAQVLSSVAPGAALVGNTQGLPIGDSLQQAGLGSQSPSGSTTSGTIPGTGGFDPIKSTFMREGGGQMVDRGTFASYAGPLGGMTEDSAGKIYDFMTGNGPDEISRLLYTSGATNQGSLGLEFTGGPYDYLQAIGGQAGLLGLVDGMQSLVQGVPGVIPGNVIGRPTGTGSLAMGTPPNGNPVTGNTGAIPPGTSLDSVIDGLMASNRIPAYLGDILKGQLTTNTPFGTRAIARLLDQFQPGISDQIINAGIAS